MPFSASVARVQQLACDMYEYIWPDVDTMLNFFQLAAWKLDIPRAVDSGSFTPEELASAVAVLRATEAAEAIDGYLLLRFHSPGQCGRISAATSCEMAGVGFIGPMGAELLDESRRLEGDTIHVHIQDAGHRTVCVYLDPFDEPFLKFVKKAHKMGARQVDFVWPYTETMLNRHQLAAWIEDFPLALLGDELPQDEVAGARAVLVAAQEAYTIEGYLYIDG